jgi:hypothetical protein
MFRSFFYRFSPGSFKMGAMVLLVAGAIAVPRIGHTQAVLPRSGQSFSFGIIEGPYSLPDSASLLQTTSLILTVVSAYSGCGIVTSPSGYSQDFSFAPGAPTIIDLPLDLIHLNDLGKTEKGLLVHTTEPVNLVLHDYVPYAGDATQILPDNALDTSYVTCGWGIWDDPSDGEDDLTEFIVTAIKDSTFVTITPSVRTLLNQADSVPFTVMLNRGECYIVKSDTSDHPSDPSLSGSTIHASAPVSVISGLTCAYVPVGIQACNELMDELIGKKWWGTHFFIQPLDIDDTGGQIVLTNSSDFVAKINTTTYNSSNGRLSMPFTGTLEIHTMDDLGNPFPVEAHQLTRSYSECDSAYGDPSLVSVLDTSYYSDTALWNTPSFFFSHSVPIICPTADLGRATLDGTPLNQLGAPSSVINGSSYSAINPPVKAGLHKILSPDPIFAISAGFYLADAYTFIAGTAGTKQPEDSTGHVVLLQADSAMTCDDFTVTASLGTPITDSEGVIVFTITITYDPATLHLVGIDPLTVLLNATYTVDTAVPGTVTITVLGTPLLTGSNLFQLIFEGWKSTAATTVSLNSGATTICGDDSENITGLPTTFRVAPSTDTFPRQFLLSNTNASLCEQLTVALNTDSIIVPADGLVISKIVVLYDPLKELLQGMTPGTLLAGQNYSEITLPLGDFQLIMTKPGVISGGNSVFRLLFTPQMPSASDTIQVQVYYLECGDTLTRDLSIIFPVGKSSDAFFAPLALSFDSTAICIPKDTGILIGDSICTALTLTNISATDTDWTVINGNGQPFTFPITVEGYTDLPLLVQFHPQTVGEKHDTITITYTYFDSTITRKIILSGTGKLPGTVQFPDSLKFGEASICSPLNSEIAFTNPTCDGIIVDSVRVTSPFSLVSKLPVKVASGDSGVIKVQYAPSMVTSDTGTAIVTLTVNGSIVTDTVTFTGTGKTTGIVTYPDTFHFGSASPCMPDSALITFTNTACDAASIDSVYVLQPFTVLSNLKLLIRGQSSNELQVEYAPDSLNSDTVQAIVMLTENGSPTIDTITFIGAGRAKDSVQFPRTLDFGTTSLCAHVNSHITFRTPTPCDSATIDSVSISPPFMLASTLPLTIDTGANGSLQVQYAPDSNGSDTGIAIISLTVNGSPVKDTVTFTGMGGGGGGANLLSTVQNDSIVFTRSECDPKDTIPFTLFNPGCDSLFFRSGFSISADIIGAWSLLATPTSALAGGDSASLALVTNDTAAGTYTGEFQTSYLDSNGVQVPYTIWISETITPTSRTMALDTTPIDLGTITPCQTIDTTIPYTNTSCVPVVFDAWRMLHYGDGFQVYNTTVQPITIPAGQTDSLHLTFDGTQSGVVYDTIVVIVGTDNDSVRRIPVQTFVPTVDSVNFIVRMPSPLAPKQNFSAGVYPDRAISASKGLTSIAGRLLFPDNDFAYDTLTASAGLQLSPVTSSVINGVYEVNFSVSNPTGIALDPATPIVQLWLEALLADSIDYSITLDSVLLNGGDPTFSQCTLATSGSETSAQFTPGCGDSILMEEMLGENIIFTSAPIPDPVTADGGFVAALTVQSFTDGVAEIELHDALGRKISHDSFSMQAGETIPYTLDLRSSPSGSYFYTIRYVSAVGTAVRDGSILVIR